MLKNSISWAENKTLQDCIWWDWILYRENISWKICNIQSNKYMTRCLNFCKDFLSNLDDFNFALMSIYRVFMLLLALS